jgi:hypothetical protein
MKRARAAWNLYWIESDGYEDCFVAARNSRSARAIEREMNGFDLVEIKATKIMPIPERTERSYRLGEEYKEKPWPWYVYGKKFFEGLGAQFRTVEGQEEMLLGDIVYEVDEYAPCYIRKARDIGQKALDELEAIAGLEYHDEDAWPGPEIHLMTALGMCLARCQQIEHYIVNSFLLGISKKQKSQYSTINDLKEGWKKKTLGNMLRCMEEAWEIQPMVRANFELFLANRNALIHGLTTSEQFDIRTHWGQRELWSFLRFFDIQSRIVKQAFRASFYASVQFGIQHFGAPEAIPKKLFKKKQMEEMQIFFEFFSPKPHAI